MADFPEFESRSKDDKADVETRFAEKLEYLEKVSNFPEIDKRIYFDDLSGYTFGETIT